MFLPCHNLTSPGTNCFAMLPDDARLVITAGNLDHERCYGCATRPSAAEFSPAPIQRGLCGLLPRETAGTRTRRMA